MFSTGYPRGGRARLPYIIARKFANRSAHSGALGEGAVLLRPSPIPVRGHRVKPRPAAPLAENIVPVGYPWSAAQGTGSEARQGARCRLGERSAEAASSRHRLFRGHASPNVIQRASPSQSALALWQPAQRGFVRPQQAAHGLTLFNNLWPTDVGCAAKGGLHYQSVKGRNDR